jgi:hypothetical protein
MASRASFGKRGSDAIPSTGSTFRHPSRCTRSLIALNISGWMSSA